MDSFDEAIAASKLYTVTLSAFGSWTVGSAFKFSGAAGLQIVTNEALAGSRFITFGERVLGTLSDRSILRANVRVQAASSGSTIPLFFLFVPHPSALTPVRFPETVNRCVGSAT